MGSEVKPDPSELFRHLQRVEHKSGMPLWQLDAPQDITVRFRVDERVSPAKFKPDPLVPGGYLANSLTLRAMKPLLFVAGSDLDEFSRLEGCACGESYDAQFWSCCPFCGRG